MTEAAKAKWQQLLDQEKRKLLKTLFINVLLNQTNLPEFMTDRDWSDLVQDTSIHFVRFRPTNGQFSVIVHIERFAYKYCVPGCKHFFTLYDYLHDHVANIQVDNLKLFVSCAEQNESVWFDFNLEAVYIWMSQNMDSV